MLNPASTRVETGRVAKEKRLWFRALVQAHVSTLDALTKPSFPGTLVLVSGHVILYGWYLAAFEALGAGGRRRTSGFARFGRRDSPSPSTRRS